ncbi:hypothetical protein L2E82_21396 [Cichorium intybus]|uniref:Uncharacterized protein n=1 Tax=Cichorium intybus TaxID=13427 RepID=A0ACB9DW25_CICIN|nr:hypothetical protein L2E82_21396 [Cichorium intybus]
MYQLLQAVAIGFGYGNLHLTAAISIISDLRITKLPSTENPIETSNPQLEIKANNKANVTIIYLIWHREILQDVKSGTDGVVVTFSNFSDEGEQRWLDSRIDPGFQGGLVFSNPFSNECGAWRWKVGLSTMVGGGGVGDSEDAGSYKPTKLQSITN